MNKNADTITVKDLPYGFSARLYSVFDHYETYALKG